MVVVLAAIMIITHCAVRGSQAWFNVWEFERMEKAKQK